MKKTLLILLCLFAVTMSETIAQNKKKSAKDSVYAAQPVTITASRQLQKVLDVPLAVTVVPQIDLQNRRGYGLDEVMSIVPGALVQARTGNHDVRITIRGYGARGAGERSNAGTSRGIRVLVDGIPHTEPDGRTAFDLIDITGASSIEVLRSSASALWGNASGGVVNISSVPTTNSPFLSAQAQFGSYGFMKNSLQAGTTTDLGKMYVSFNNTTFDGWRVHSNSAITQFNVGLMSEVNLRTKLGVFMSAASNIFRIAGPLTQAQFDSSAQQAQASMITRDERRFNRLGSLGMTLEHAIDDHNSITSMAFLQSKFLQRSERNTFRDFTRYHVGGNLIYKNAGKFTDDIASHFLVGMDEQYQDGAILFYGLNKSGGRDTVLQQDKREGANNFGIFGQEEVVFNDKFSVMLGARYDKIAYYNEIYFDGGNKNDIAEKIYDNLTPKFGLNYRLASDMSVYANVGGGIEVPAGNEVDPPGPLAASVVNPLLEPMISTTYELGWKAMPQVDDFIGLGAAGVSLDVAAYMIGVKNDIIPYDAGRFYISAGKTQRIGAELGAAVRLENGVTVSAAFTYCNSKYVEYDLSAIYSRPRDSVEGQAAFKNYTDNKIAGMPDMYSTVRVKWLPKFLDRLSIDAEMRTVGSYFADNANMLSVASYMTIDAGVSYEQPIVGGLSARGFVRAMNLTDQKYAASVWINPERIKNASPAFLESGLPRNFSAGINLTWRRD
ncbi:MAG: TonB-dependent receptor [Candidatus Kapaibacterium sp.]